MERWNSGLENATNKKLNGKISQYQPHQTPLLFNPYSVSTLSEVLRQAIENEQKLMNELLLPGAKLEIREVSGPYRPHCMNVQI